MPSKSEAQRKLFGMALAYKRGENKDGASDEVIKLSELPEKTLKAYASKVEESISTTGAHDQRLVNQKFAGTSYGRMYTFLDWKANKHIIESYTGNPGDELTHKHDKTIKIELIEPTNKGWKVYQTTDGKKKKIAFFDKQDLTGDKAIFEARKSKYDYQVYHDTYTSAVNTAKEWAKLKGFEVDEDDMWQQVAMGNGRPHEGQTIKHSIGLTKDGKKQRKHLQFQVYGMRNQYELNMYIN